jgi:hypothetical protein
LRIRWYSLSVSVCELTGIQNAMRIQAVLETAKDIEANTMFATHERGKTRSHTMTIFHGPV